MLLTVAAVGLVGLLAVWGTESPERAAYDKIQVGMSQDEVHAIMSGSSAMFSSGGLSSWSEMWSFPNGAIVDVHFYDNRVTDKGLEEGDPSLTARLKRLAGRLPLR